MVVVAPAPAALDTRIVSLYYTKDPLIGNLPVVVFHGPSTTTNSTHNSSRIQAHVFSIAGYQCFPRLTISPTSPLYAAVHRLPEDRQGDEICRGLAVALLKYYTEMPTAVKKIIKSMVAVGRYDEKAPAMFDEQHAAKLASNMIRLDNATEIAAYLSTALAEKSLSWTDVDVALPRGSITKIDPPDPLADLEEKLMFVDDGRPPIDYGQFTEIVELFGSPSFLPTSTLKRAPSKPTGMKTSTRIDGDQIETLQRQMRELLETEKSYVLKLHDLVKSCAAEYCRNANSRPSSVVQPSERAMLELFPACLTDILSLNAQFLDALGALMGDEELVPAVNHPSDQAPWTTDRDPTGADSFARVLLEYFPRFRAPYQDYLKASDRFPRILNEFCRDSASSFAQALHQTGEQRLRSWLIEPVQRLPRYSLYISSIVDQLPTTHSAVSKLLRAKDIITDICALDSDGPLDNTGTVKKLRELIAKWPSAFWPRGRLLSAVDAAELKAPYRVITTPKEGVQSLLLLFPEVIVVLRKTGENPLSARGLLAEIDRSEPRLMTVADGSLPPPQALTFAASFRLNETRFTESSGGRLISLTSVRKAFQNIRETENGTDFITTTKEFCLFGSYDGKAARWGEEIARARIENRYPEKMRDDVGWGLRTISPEGNSLGLVSAIFENDMCAGEGYQRESYGRIQVVVHHDGEAAINSPYEIRNRGVEIIARITIMESSKYLLEFTGFNNFSSTDHVSGDDFIAVFIKRLSNLQRLHNQPMNEEIARAHVAASQKIAESIRPRLPIEEVQSRSKFRPPSPVKAIASFIGGSLKESSGSLRQRGVGASDVFTEDSTILKPSALFPPSPGPQPRGIEDPAKNQVTLISTPEANAYGSIPQLETTLMTYLVALHSRRGNVVGKVLRGRIGCDELRVNELCNALIGDPSQHQAAAEVPVDVLFVGFEKFLNVEWKARIGPVLSKPILQKMQTIFEGSSTGQMVVEFHHLLGEMTPQNRRAFISIIRLLADLLEASGNDGDRGALTATFAETLVESNPHQFISILDRLVEDSESLLDDNSRGAPNLSGATPDPLQRTRSVNTGSLSSNGSSLRKRFGFGTLSRENSKTESESKVGQMWRTLSKKTSREGEPQHSSLSKAFSSRTRSTDDARRGLPPHPVSRDRPASANSVQREQGSRPGSAHNTLNSLDTIGEGTSQSFQTSPRKKRRSSLSDLTQLQGVGSPSSFTVQSQIGNSPASIQPFQTARTPLRSPSPSKLPSPVNRKENIAFNQTQTLTERSINRRADDFGMASSSPKKRELSSTKIPSLKPLLQDRSSPSVTPTPSPKKPASSPQKLRIQSPQKLRERMEREKKAIQEAGPGLQAELSKIGEELSALKLQRPGSNIYGTDLATRVSATEKKVGVVLEDLKSRTAAIQSDLESSIVVNEKKSKNLDKLYREANVENDLLYERFNGELEKILKRVNGTGVEEMKVQLKEAQDEAARLRKDNQRLKREVVGLRSQLKGE